MTHPRLDLDDLTGLDRLLAIMAALRDPATGCPWDIEQSFATIAPYTLEEAHEVADAIERQAWPELKGELGDLLFQTVYHAQMAAEAGHFSFADVVAAICDKMISRHPHVFGTDSRDKTAEQQTKDWEAQKAREWLARAETRLEEVNRQAQEQLKLLSTLLKEEGGAKKDRGAPPSSIQDTVRKLARQGWSPDEIARAVKISRGEVELILELGGK